MALCTLTDAAARGVMAKVYAAAAELVARFEAEGESSLLATLALRRASARLLERGRARPRREVYRRRALGEEVPQDVATSEPAGYRAELPDADS